MSKTKKVAPAATPNILDQTPPVAVAADPVRKGIQFAYDAPGRELRWSFGAGIEDVAFIMPESGDLLTRASAHGFKQRIGDAAAIPRDTSTGASATLADKRAAMARIVAALEAGEWEVRAEARKPLVIDVKALAAAIAAIRGKPFVATTAWLESKTEPQRAVMAGSVEFAAEYARLVAEGKAAKPLSDDMAAELDAIPNG